uniref:Non-specific serine/threonine protein kinase n=1 Tax=Davidia involucrata TaxID=16924 RepID=A0A5B6YSG1_DAVIN
MCDRCDSVGSSASSSVVFLIYCILLISLCLSTTAQLCNNTIGNFTINSTYAKNRNLMLSSLPSNASTNGGFYKGTIGQDPDKVYGLAVCRGDISPKQCFNCIDFPIQEIIKSCPNQKEAVHWPPWDPRCIVRYSNQPFFGIMQSWPGYDVSFGPEIATNMDEFDQALDSLIDSVVSRAQMGSSTLMFATGKKNFSDYRTIYALMQCTPDLSSTDCGDCLGWALRSYRTCCNRRKDVTILRPSCIFQYNLDPFFNSTADAPLPPPPPPPPPPPIPVPFPPRPLNTRTEDNGRSTSQAVVIIVVPIVISIVLIALACAFLRLRKPKKDVENEDASKSEESLRFDFGTIRAVTNDFSDANKLGQGGFGSVYKGRLSNGQEIAVKRLAGVSSQGEIEFKNEIVSMARLQHRNLVRLQGFCLEGKERLLIYEFVPNASLDRFIFDPIKRLLLNWERRYKIIVGIAQGLLYLHEDSQQRIIHRDLKAGNILLDGEMNPKIADFGTARLFVVDQSQGNTKRIVGTYGYMAPEYAKFGRFSVKSDVFSFGVLILEIVSGKKNSSYRSAEQVDHLLSYVWKIWKKGTPLKLIDPILSDGSRSEKMRCIQIGLLCVQENVAKRPTMGSVVLMLSSFSMSLQLPSKPAFLMHGSMEPHMASVKCSPSGVAGSHQSTNQSVNFSINEAPSTVLYPR